MDRVAEALFGQTRRQLLALFFGRPHGSYYLRQIAKETGAGIGAVQRELANLEKAGLITREPRGSQVYFAANRESPVFADLSSLLTKTAGVADVLREALMALPARSGIRFAFMYGSVASGEQSAASDVDLLVVGDVSTRDLLPALREAQQRVGREVNPSVYAARELREKVRAGNAFVRRVLKGPHIMLIGTDDELGALVKQQVDRSTRHQRGGAPGPAVRRRS